MASHLRVAFVIFLEHSRIGDTRRLTPDGTTTRGDPVTSMRHGHPPPTAMQTASVPSIFRSLFL